jgi:predicted  nucleic acid-binding Zn-ribbon protein
MLVNKKNHKKKNESKIVEDNIQAMRSWVRKIEQTTSSISSRLSAVEKRISTQKIDPAKHSISGVTIIEGPIEKVISELKENGKSEEKLDYIFGVVDNEFSMLQDEIDTQQEKLNDFADKIQQINRYIHGLEDNLKKTREIEIKFLTNFRQRIEKIEHSAPPVMKIGKIEVPIEISGLIAGFIAITAAVFVNYEMTELLISPVFLGTIGLIFIASALFKSIKTRPS